MNLCGSYGGEYISRDDGVVVHNNKRQYLRLEQYLTEAWKPITS